MCLDLPDIAYTGIDINRGFLDKAQERTSGSKSFHFTESDVLAFAPGSTYDIVLAINGYHHFQDTVKSQFLQKAHDLLQPDG